jgi:hypothetical protein
MREPGEDLGGLGESEESDYYDDSLCFMVDEDAIVESFILTFHKGYYYAELDDKLSLDQRETSVAHSTQASYIKPDNWQERNRIGLRGGREGGGERGWCFYFYY